MQIADIRPDAKKTAADISPPDPWGGLAIVVALIVSLSAAEAFSGASLPWTTYEAENMTVSGGTLLGPDYTHNTVASESYGRQCVQLNGTGQYVQFTAQTAANSIVVRYSVPDTSNGTGTNYTISLYTNGVFVETLPLTSAYSWLYGDYPWTNNPSAGSPRDFYDEVHTNGLNINPGDVVRLQVNSTDTAANYDINLVDLENVAAPLTQPANSLSIVSYGADTNGITNSTTALQNCINAAVSEGKTVWVPAGTYLIQGTINLPSNTTIQGAGMWYSTLIGNPSLYNTTPADRVFINGNGSNINLADFAIRGFLNYRNDSEPNDGLVGSYGTGSTISGIWVEHTKTGAWIDDSSGLVVNGCRFRDTIADGININYGMQNTKVTNCTDRGNGDDCFAMWPTATAGSYSYSGNVVTHCTAVAPWLANGGAIYGGANNTIEDCQFFDTTYNCGVLISTTFPVGNNVFSPTTVVQRCDLVRCGGDNTPEGYGWRGALEFCEDTYSGGINGVNINNLNITNSASYGMTIRGALSTLTNALAASVYIPNSGFGQIGDAGLVALSGARGSLTVSNSVENGVNNASGGSFTFNFVTNAIGVTVQASPSVLSFTVDGTNYSSTQTFNWIPGSNHTLATTSTQSGGTGIQYSWSAWSDGGAISHTITPLASSTYTANFMTNYYLTMDAATGGSVGPASLWTNSGANVNVSAVANDGYNFSNWSGSGTGSYSGNNSAASVTMSGPITETATFIPDDAISVTVGTSPVGQSFTVDGTNYNTAQMFGWTPGSNHSLDTISLQSGGTGVQYVWTSWSDGGLISHNVSPSVSTNYTANFTTQYYLTMDAGSGGSISPGNLWTNSGVVMNISATANNGYNFSNWSGSGTGSYSGNNSAASVTMNGPITETASFTPLVESLTFLQQPGNVLQGAAITPEVQVQALGIDSQTVSNAAIAMSLNGTGTLAGTLTNMTDINGIADFNNLSINQPGTKALTAAVIGGTSTVISSSFLVIGPVVALAFTAQPGSAVAGVPFGQQPVLETVDAAGSATTNGLPASLIVDVALTNGVGNLLGTTKYDIGTGASNGTVAFSNLAIDTAGSGNQLVASTALATSPPLSGAVLWLDSSDPSTLTTNATRVQGWRNKGSGGAGMSGTNLWFTQNTTTLQPWLTNQLNGRPVVTFNKNGNGYSAGCTYLGNIGESSYTNSGSQMTYFLVARQWENSIGWQGPVSFSTNGQTDGQGAAGMVILTDGSQSAPYPLGIQRNHPGTPMQADMTAVSANTAFELTFEDNAGSASLDLNESSGLVSSNSANIVNGISPYTYGINDVTVGGRLEPDPTMVDNGWDGDVAEVLVYNTALSVADRVSVENYLMNKWFTLNSGLSISNALSAPFIVESSGTILGVSISGASTVTITCATIPDSTYYLETTTNLASAIWTIVAGSATNATGTSVTFTVPIQSNDQQRYFRIVSP